MLESPFDALVTHVTEADSLKVVLIETLPGDNGSGTTAYRTYHLDPVEAVREAFRRALGTTLRTIRREAADGAADYEPGWVPAEGEMAIGGDEIIEGSPLLPAVRRGLAADRAGLPAPGPDEDDEPRPARGYAIVASVKGYPQDDAYLIRRLDPVTRLTRNRIVAAVSETRLTTTERILGFDSGIDVIVWRQMVVVRNVNAFEALFFPPAVRADAAVRVAKALHRRLPVANIEDLVETARVDSVFAGRLRRLQRSERFGRVTPQELHQSAEAFGLHGTLAPDGVVTFVAQGNWRWRFLEVLEDAFLASPASGTQYRSGSAKTWIHRRVEGVVRNGPDIAALCGTWGTVDARVALMHVHRVQGAYYVEESGQKTYITENPTSLGGLVAPRGSDDLLAALTACPPTPNAAPTPGDQGTT